MTEKEARDKIIGVLTRKDYVTFAEVVRELGEDNKGDHAICHPNDQNLILWAGLSSEASAAWRSIYSEGLIDLKPCSIAIYLIDGLCSTMPVLRSARRIGKLKNPHWLPITFSLRKKVAS